MLLSLTSSGCHLTELPELNLPLTATLTVDFSDPDTKPDDTGGFRYYYEGESYLATYNAWENYACPESPQFFAAYNDVDQTVWLAHCVEGIFLSTVHFTTGTSNTQPAIFRGEIDGGHHETIEFDIPSPILEDIQNGATQLILTFNYQND